MRERRSFWIASALLLATACAQPRTPAVEAQAASTRLAQPTPVSSVPRTPDGKPDLQGFWNSATLTPLERPRNASDKTALTPEEAAEIERGTEAWLARADAPLDPDRSAPPVGGDGSTGAAGGVGGYNAFWIDIGTDVAEVNGQARTSLIVDPPDGRVPALTPEARQRLFARRNRLQAPTSDAPESVAAGRPGAYDDFELRPLAERCLLGFGSTSGPPALPVMYNNIKQIVQTRDHVMILNEMVHDARIVRMNAEHLPPSLRRWLGDSIGRWEGDTLVVETTNFTDKTRFRGSSPDLKVTERFTRVDEKTLLYQFTVEDPNTWTSPWSGEYPWTWSEEPVYEYACHEGNQAIEMILKGARLREAEEAAKAGK